MQPFVRKAEARDLQQIYDLICDLEGEQVDVAAFERMFSYNINNPDAYYFVAEMGNRIVGFISLHVQHILHHSKPTCELQELNIKSELRGSGIGAMLMKEVELIAKELDLEEIELTTKIHRDRAQAFYRKLGYAHTHNKFVKKL